MTTESGAAARVWRDLASSAVVGAAAILVGATAGCALGGGFLVDYAFVTNSVTVAHPRFIGSAALVTAGLGAFAAHRLSVRGAWLTTMVGIALLAPTGLVPTHTWTAGMGVGWLIVGGVRLLTAARRWSAAVVAAAALAAYLTLPDLLRQGMPLRYAEYLPADTVPLDTLVLPVAAAGAVTIVAAFGVRRAADGQGRGADAATPLIGAALVGVGVFVGVHSARWSAPAWSIGATVAVAVIAVCAWRFRPLAVPLLVSAGIAVTLMWCPTGAFPTTWSQLAWWYLSAAVAALVGTRWPQPAFATGLLATVPIISLLDTEAAVAPTAPLLAIPLGAYALASAAGTVTRSEFATVAGGLTLTLLPYAAPVFTPSMPVPIPDDAGWTAYWIDLRMYGAVSAALVFACALAVRRAQR